MKSTALACAIAAACLGFASLTFAQGYEQRGQRSEASRTDQRGPMGREHRDAGHRGFDQRDHRNDHRGYNQRDNRNAPRSFEQRNARHDQHRPMDRDGYHGASRNPHQGVRNDHRGFDQRDARNDRHFNGHGPQFQRGGRIPVQYRDHQYVVNDWRPHRLSAPPQGQQWIQVGADYALIVIATGIIAQLVLSN